MSRPGVAWVSCSTMAADSLRLAELPPRMLESRCRSFMGTSSKWVAGQPACPYLALVHLPENPLYSEIIHRIFRY